MFQYIPVLSSMGFEIKVTPFFDNTYLKQVYGPKVAEVLYGVALAGQVSKS